MPKYRTTRNPDGTYTTEEIDDSAPGLDLIGYIFYGIYKVIETIWNSIALRTIVIGLIICSLAFGIISGTVNWIHSSNIENVAEFTLLDDGTYEFSSLSGYNKNEIIIPSEHDGIAITRIGASAFENHDYVTSVSIPASVTEIGDGAFKNCKALTSITIPLSVTKIGNNAFEECEALTSITIPVSVKSIGDYAFTECDALKSIVIPDSVVSMGEGVFYLCDGLEQVTLSKSLSTISKRCFSFCKSLTSFEIPNSVKTIGDDAFAFCEGLVSINIPSSVTKIGAHAFCHAKYLTTINYSGTKAQWEAIDKFVGYDSIEGILNWNDMLGGYAGGYTVKCTDGTIE